MHRAVRRAVGGAVLAAGAVQKADVRGIVVPLVRLQVVAIDEHLGRVRIFGSGGEEIIGRKFRRRARPEVGEERARLLEYRVGRLLDLIFERAVLRLGRLFETLSGDVVEPAVIETAQAAAFEPAEREVGTAMSAVAIEQSDAAVLVAEEHEFFAEHVDRNRRTAGRQLRT